MADDRIVEIYGNAKGASFMEPIHKLVKDGSVSEADIAKALDDTIVILNSLPREQDMQIVVVEDGLIVAVESLTTGKLLWCN